MYYNDTNKIERIKATLKNVFVGNQYSIIKQELLINSFSEYQNTSDDDVNKH